MNATANQAQKPPKKFYKTSVSIPADMHRKAVKRASAMSWGFSTYIQRLVDEDLRKCGAVK